MTKRSGIRNKLCVVRDVKRHDSLYILQGTLEGGRRRGRQRICRMNNVKEWTPLAYARTAHDGLPQRKQLEEDLW